MTYLVLDGRIDPTGSFKPHGGGSAPTGYLLCDGAAISRTTYANLFAVIGTAYGVGDGSTTFNVPDMQGKVPVGIGASGVTSIGDTGGEQEHTLIISETPAHTHTSPMDLTEGTSSVNTKSGSSPPNSNPVSSSVGGGGAHENMQPYVGTEYIIKT